MAIPIPEPTLDPATTPDSIREYRDVVLYLAFRGGEAVTDEELREAFKECVAPRVPMFVAQYLREHDDLERHYPEMRLAAEGERRREDADRAREADWLRNYKQRKTETV